MSKLCFELHSYGPHLYGIPITGILSSYHQPEYLTFWPVEMFLRLQKHMLFLLSQELNSQYIENWRWEGGRNSYSTQVSLTAFKYQHRTLTKLPVLFYSLIQHGLQHLQKQNL